jgi:integrase
MQSIFFACASTKSVALKPSRRYSVHMPEKLDTTHQIIPNELVVYLRPGSAVWQCRYKVDGVWLVKSTKKKEYNAAVQAAHVLQISSRLRVEQNFSVATKKFKDVAKLALKAMEDKTEAGDGKVSYEQYARITNDFLIPFFGKRDVDSINGKALQEYAVFRTQKMGKEPAYSTVRKHNVTLNKIFEEAVARGFMTTTQKPKLETKGKKAETFPTFTVDEVNVILASLQPWVGRGRNEHKKELRHLLSCYVRVLIDTGARPGKELLELQWKNITFKVQFVDETVMDIDDNGSLVESNIQIGVDERGEPEYKQRQEAHVVLYVDGKTDGRFVNGFNETFAVLREIVARNYKDKTLSQLTKEKSSEFVFRTPKGEYSKNYNEMFDDFLEEHNLLLDPNTGKKRVFYSFRSAHATAVMNLDDVSPRNLALQLGNSPEVIRKHYDRANSLAISESVKAPKARAALFKQVEVPDINKPKKVQRRRNS